MQLHQIQPTHQNKSKKRVGRGGKRGTYSGRGMKGQKSRAGHKIRPAIRDLMQRTPKLRGVKNQASNYKKRKKMKKLKKAGVSGPIKKEVKKEIKKENVKS